MGFQRVFHQLKPGVRIRLASQSMAGVPADLRERRMIFSWGKAAQKITEKWRCPWEIPQKDGDL